MARKGRAGGEAKPVRTPAGIAAPADAAGMAGTAGAAGTADAARGGFSSRIGFILSAAGSAIGFGSIARFPMNTANNGGAAFVLVYVLIMILVGIPMMVAEFSIGRRTRLNAVGSFKMLEKNPKTRWRGVGIYYVVLAAFFLSWYSIAAGWVLRYLFASLTGGYFGDGTAYQAGMQAGPDALFWHAAVMALTIWGVSGSISKGIERINLIMMPALFVILIVLAGYAATLSGSGAGYSFYLKPDFSKITVPLLIAATGQAFFSLSLGQGAMLTYASYMDRRQSLAGNAATISLSTVGVAITSGFMIFPMLASFGLLSTERAGLALIFGPLAEAFGRMGSPVGNIVGVLFFTATFFAAFTSSVSLMEPAMAYLVDEFKLTRRKAALVVGLSIYIAGIAVAFSVDLLGLESQALTDLAVLLGVLAVAVFVGHRLPRAEAIAEMDRGDGSLRIGRYAYPLVKYVYPAILGGLILLAIFGAPAFLGGGDPCAPNGLLDEFREFFDPAHFENSAACAAAE